MTDILWPGDQHAGDLFTDTAVLDAMIALEAAWSSGLTKAGIAPPGVEVSADRLRALVSDADRESIAVSAESGGNPVIPLVKTLRAGLGDGGAATWLHRGLTSQDLVDTALISCTATAFTQLRAELREQVRALVRLADEHRATPMVARTLTQQAIPMTFGLKVAGWLRGVLDAVEQVDRLVFPVQIGGAAGTLAAAYELAAALDDPASAVLEATTVAARELGLEPTVPWHTVRTEITRSGDAAVGCTDAWGHLANDVLTLSRTEIGELGEGAAGGSSTMPNKANPVLSVLIRRAGLTAPMLGATLHVAAADALEERSSGAWHAEWDALRTLMRHTVIAGRQTTRLVADLRVHADRMRANLDAAGDAVTAEQRTMAKLADHPPRGDYFGAADRLIQIQLDRAEGVQ
ncbi:lyase family protein [Gordonia sp. CPCC 205515]|uniref:lyase family protein n=1 Tax=Gordonia sp. CPCC 205515 TaxID=3140791 RepID=UPI003AF3A62A